MLPLRLCENCQDPFQPSRKERRFCSEACYGRWNASTKRQLPDIQCPSCEQYFRPKNSSAVYCSRPCQSQGLAKRYRGPDSPLWKRHIAQCEQCHTQFFQRKPSARFCSLACRNTAMALFLASCDTPRQRRLLDKICEECQQSYRPRGNHTKYCSRTCKSQAVGRHLRERHHAQWKTSMRRRPSSKHSLRRQVLQRDPACQDCQSVARPQVHHVDGNAANNDPANLVRLCQWCHAQRHQARGEAQIALLIMSHWRYRE